VETLRFLYDEALAEEDVIGLSIGSRPDCVPDETLALIRSYGIRAHVWLEFGVQSLQDRTLTGISYSASRKSSTVTFSMIGSFLSISAAAHGNP
jgi:hypothetical protein